MARRELLLKLLRPIVEEWGTDGVLSAVRDLTIGSSADPDAYGGARGQRSRSSRSRLSALEQAERASLRDDKAELIRSIAERYDRKEFLPSIADVRELLILLGRRPPSMKSRSDAFRILLGALEPLPVERLEGIAGAGSSQLGPLSDAISEAAQLMSRERGRGQILPPSGTPGGGKAGDE